MKISVEAYLKTDRQWRREERLAHAQYQLERACTPEQRTFWSAVLEANTNKETYTWVKN